MKTEKWSIAKIASEISFFLKREMSITLVFWLIIFIITLVLYRLGLIKS
jgi:hypothetical protein